MTNSWSSNSPTATFVTMGTRTSLQRFDGSEQPWEAADTLAALPRFWVHSLGGQRTTGERTTSRPNTQPGLPSNQHLWKLPRSRPSPRRCAARWRCAKTDRIDQPIKTAALARLCWARGVQHRHSILRSRAARRDARWGEWPGFAGTEGTGKSPIDQRMSRLCRDRGGGKAPLSIVPRAGLEPARALRLTTF
jgi:hypothetical protein